MLPFILGAVAISAAGIAVYKNYSGARVISLGAFAVWGRPNVGKTTFINRLKGEDISFAKKEITVRKHVVEPKNLIELDGRSFKIDKIVDMPGTDDRENDWLKEVQRCDHIFYMINLSENNNAYLSQVCNDLKKTVNAINLSDKKSKKYT